MTRLKRGSDWHNFLAEGVVKEHKGVISLADAAKIVEKRVKRQGGVMY